jgi:hypothetical protein
MPSCLAMHWLSGAAVPGRRCIWLNDWCYHAAGLLQRPEAGTKIGPVGRGGPERRVAAQPRPARGHWAPGAWHGPSDAGQVPAGAGGLDNSVPNARKLDRRRRGRLQCKDKERCRSKGNPPTCCWWQPSGSPPVLTGWQSLVVPDPLSPSAALPDPHPIIHWEAKLIKVPNAPNYPLISSSKIGYLD